ncbi:hypothetical protein [Streptomyces peucetius]|uniref:Secreted protein n=1 Tax=Streptomyces peucetius TaxID=1950 RepID=A0ABY6IID9_STRPE|nr:hypothetical protein [Streptomyces peucetius]UYQ65674.1 hypothetical protein OGH68_32275 [Streptomyces peucetius]
MRGAVSSSAAWARTFLASAATLSFSLLDFSTSGLPVFSEASGATAFSVSRTLTVVDLFAGVARPQLVATERAGEVSCAL